MNTPKVLSTASRRNLAVLQTLLIGCAAPSAVDPEQVQYEVSYPPTTRSVLVKPLGPEELRPRSFEDRLRNWETEDYEVFIDFSSGAVENELHSKFFAYGLNNQGALFGSSRGLVIKNPNSLQATPTAYFSGLPTTYGPGWEIADISPLIDHPDGYFVSGEWWDVNDSGHAIGSYEAGLSWGAVIFDGEQFEFLPSMHPIGVDQFGDFYYQKAHAYPDYEVFKRVDGTQQIVSAGTRSNNVGSVSVSANGIVLLHGGSVITTLNGNSIEAPNYYFSADAINNSGLAVGKRFHLDGSYPHWNAWILEVLSGHAYEPDGNGMIYIYLTHVTNTGHIFGHAKKEVPPGGHDTWSIVDGEVVYYDFTPIYLSQKTAYELQDRIPIESGFEAIRILDANDDGVLLVKGKQFGENKICILTPNNLQQ